MAFAFKFFFTEESARPIRRIWDELALAELSSLMKDSGSTPGVTLGVFEAGRESAILDLAKVFAAESSSFRVGSWGVGVFPTDPAQVFLGITLSPELSVTHSRFINSASKVGEISDYYKSGNWLPHSTLAIRCNPKDVPAVMQVSLQHETRLDFQIGSIAVVEIGTARVAGEFGLTSKRP